MIFNGFFSLERPTVIDPRVTLSFWLFALLLLSAVSAGAMESSKPELSFMTGTGVLIDIAPFGVEQVYPVLSVGVVTSGSPAFRIRPSFAMNRDSWMLRLPLHLSFDLLSLDLNGSCFDQLRLAMYGGGGLEIYRSELHDTKSPLLEAGITFFLGRVYLDAAASRAYRSYNEDSDLSFTGGILFYL